MRGSRVFAFGQHEFIHGGRDEWFCGLRLRGEDSTNSLIANSLIEEKARLTDERYGLYLRVMRKATHLSLDKISDCAFGTTIKPVLHSSR
jgi:hypothetical protein